MTIPALVLVTASLAGPRPDVPPPPGPMWSPLVSATGDAQQLEPRSQRVGERPHTVGLGGQLAVTNRGAGGGMRWFFAERVGVNLDVLWYQRGSRYTSNPQQGSTFAVLPSFILMLTKPDPTRDVDVRPYVGAGLNYVRSSTPITTISGTTTLQRRSGTGGQVFGGVELTFREADWMTISAEGIYHKLPVNYVNASIVGGFNYVLAFHFYLK